MKLCQIYKHASHYRKAIYQLIDQEIGSDWYLGMADDVKEIDRSIFKGKVVNAPYHSWSVFKWQSGTMKALFKDYDTYMFIGDPSSMNIWLFCVLSRLIFPKKRIFFWSHGWYGKETRTKTVIKKIFFKLANGGVFLYGNYARNLMIKEGFNPNKLFVIHNSLDYDKQLDIRERLTYTSIFKSHFVNDNPILIFVGRLTPQKKLQMIIEALRKCKEKGYNYNLAFVGDGNQRNMLEQLSLSYNLQKQVWFYGECYDENKLGELIYNADLCVSPGNVGLTAIHSLMFGTPVCTHNNYPYQMPEFEAVREGETGTFFEDGSVESLTDKIISWFENNGRKQAEIQRACFDEIDSSWNPHFQIEVFKKNLA